MRFFRALSTLTLTLTVACGSVASHPPGGDAGIDAEVSTDAALDAASIDAPPPTPPPPGTARELTVVGGAVADGRFRFELEVTGGIAGGAARGANHAFDHALTVTLPQGAN